MLYGPAVHSNEDAGEDLDIFPDYDARVIVQRNGKFEEFTARWGFPPLKRDWQIITNIRNLESWWWKERNREFMTGDYYRCIIPFSKFAEPPRKPVWFRIKSRSVSFFAGIFMPWSGERLTKIKGKSRRVKKEKDWLLFAFLTTAPNEIIKPYHSGSMPVILSTQREVEDWFCGGIETLKKAQKPIENKFLGCLNPR